MASTDNGKQLITFKYQQEGTAEGFNKLLCGVIPTGVISGGDLIKVDDSNVNISKLQMMISDGNVVVHVQTTETASVSLSTSKRHIVATFNWANLVNNFVTFEAMSLDEIPKNAIILGSCVFVGSTITGFDYTRKTWSSTYLNNDFLYDNSYNTKSPSFNVTPIENVASGTIGFVVGVGKGIINGKEVEISSPITVYLDDSNPDVPYHHIIKAVSQSRIDVAILTIDENNLIQVRYINGQDSISPKPPIYPSYGLPIAKFTYTGNINMIDGSQITNIYSNNYISCSPTIGRQEGGVDVDTHTLFL